MGNKSKKIGLVIIFLATLFLPSKGLVAKSLSPIVRIFNLRGQLEKEFLAFDQSFQAGINLSRIDLGSDGIDEILVGAGFGEKPWVKIFRQDGSLINQFLAFEDNFRGGVNVTAGDLDGDGRDEIVVSSQFNGGPQIRVFDGFGNLKFQFFAAEENLRNGIQIAIGDINGDKKNEIIVGIGDQGKFLIRVFDNRGENLNKDFYAFDNFKIGELSLATIDLGGDGTDEILVGSGGGEQSLVKIFRADGSLINQFPVYHKDFQGAVKIAAADFDQDNRGDIVVTPGFNGGPHLRIFDGFGKPRINPGFFVFDQEFKGGVNVTIVNYGEVKKIAVSPRQQEIDSEILPQYIEIDISDQKLFYWQNGLKLAEYPISSGRQSMPTPLGRFKIIEKKEVEYSKPYNLYMPHWMEFTYSGAGLHGLPYWKIGGKIIYEGVNHLGLRVSHGCVRLPLDAAERIYHQWAKIGTPVIVHK